MDLSCLGGRTSRNCSSHSPVPVVKAVPVECNYSTTSTVGYSVQVTKDAFLRCGVQDGQVSSFRSEVVCSFQLKTQLAGFERRLPPSMFPTDEGKRPANPEVTKSCCSFREKVSDLF